MNRKHKNKDRDEWSLDFTTGTPILMYKQCSVIQDKQAKYLFDLLEIDKKGKMRNENESVCQSVLHTTKDHIFLPLEMVIPLAVSDLCIIRLTK